MAEKIVLMVGKLLYLAFIISAGQSETTSLTLGAHTMERTQVQLLKSGQSVQSLHPYIHYLVEEQITPVRMGLAR